MITFNRLITLLDCDAYLIDQERRKRMKKTKDSDENLFHWILAENGSLGQMAKLKENEAAEGLEEGIPRRRSLESQPTSNQSPSESSLTEEQVQENASAGLDDIIQEEPTFFTNSSREDGSAVALELQDGDVSVSEISSTTSPVRL